MMQRTLQIIAADANAADPGADEAGVLRLPNDADPSTVPLEGVVRIELEFPKFTDGRAFSQAALLRRRRRFGGDIRAIGDVLLDQLVQMQRVGFSSAVLRHADKIDALDVARQFERYCAHYQGDSVDAQPLFSKAR